MMVPALCRPATRPACRAPLRVAVVDEELPYPLNSGKRLRTFNLLTRLARRHHLTYLCHRNTSADEARRAEAVFHDHGIATIVVNRCVPTKAGPLFYARLAANMLSSWPYSVATHHSRALCRAVASVNASQEIDLWQCEWTPYLAALDRVTGTPRLVMAHNVESLIWQRYCETAATPLERWYVRKQWRKFVAFERSVFAQADQVVAVSAADAARIEAQFGASGVEVVENGVDTEYFQPALDPRSAGDILFLGSLDWRPNLDALQILLESIFPAVRAGVPEARLSVVGRNPPPWLAQRVRALPGVELHANVLDVRPYLARSSLLVVPLRIGGGSRLKILEALASGLPVVTTHVGAEGLDLEPEKHLVMAEDSEQLAAAIVRTLRAPETAGAQAAYGRDFVVKHHSWDLLADKLERVWMSCVAGVVPKRCTEARR
jgi:glycosyltransferase involved in cell wall biosynthesis